MISVQGLQQCHKEISTVEGSSNPMTSVAIANAMKTIPPIMVTTLTLIHLPTSAPAMTAIVVQTT